MRLTCPSCDAIYEVDEIAIPASGRRVRCSACGAAWRVSGDGAAVEERSGDRLRLQDIPSAQESPQTSPDIDAAPESPITEAQESPEEAAEVPVVGEPEETTEESPEAAEAESPADAEAAEIEPSPAAETEPAPEEQTLTGADVSTAEAAEEPEPAAEPEPSPEGPAPAEETAVAAFAADEAPAAEAPSPDEAAAPEEAPKAAYVPLKLKREAPPEEAEEEATVGPSPMRSVAGFLIGFAAIMILASPYLFRSEIVAAVPSAAPMVEAYAGTVRKAQDGIRSTVDRVVDTVRYLTGGLDIPPDAPSTASR